MLDKYSIEEVVKEIIEWLKVDKLNYFDTTTFARDFYIGSDLMQEEKDHFLQKYRLWRFQTTQHAPPDQLEGEAKFVNDELVQEWKFKDEKGEFTLETG